MILFNLFNNEQLGEMFSQLLVKSVHELGHCWSQGGRHNIQEILLKMRPKRPNLQFCY